MSLILKDSQLKGILNDVINEQNHEQHEKMIYQNIQFINNCDYCLCCGKAPNIDINGLVISLVKHHVSYFPQKIAYVHNECHNAIHTGKYPLLIQFEGGDSRKFYEQQKMENKFN